MASRSSSTLLNTARRSLEHTTLSTRQQFICKACRTAIATAQPLRPRSLQQPTSFQSQTQTQTQSHPFSTSTSSLKKSSSNPKSQRKSPAIEHPHKNDTHIPDNKHTRNLDSEADPYDHSTLQSAIDSAIARLKDSLTKTRDAGRVSVQNIEDLPVDINTKNPSSQGPGSQPHKERQQIKDIASVVPKGGRTMQVFISSEDHVKPISSAIQASPYSLVPQPDPQNPLLLTVPVPPATAETRAQAAAEAKKCFDKASLDVRNARGDAQKRHKRMEQEKVVVPDELRKAHKSMEEVARKGQDEVKRVFDSAVRALQNV